jgi:hypothetical protein
MATGDDDQSYRGPAWRKHVLRTAFTTLPGIAIIVIALILTATLPPTLKVAGPVFGAAALVMLCRTKWPPENGAG